MIEVSKTLQATYYYHYLFCSFKYEKTEEMQEKYFVSKYYHHSLRLVLVLENKPHPD